MKIFIKIRPYANLYEKLYVGPYAGAYAKTYAGALLKSMFLYVVGYSSVFGRRLGIRMDNGLGTLLGLLLGVGICRELKIVRACLLCCFPHVLATASSCLNKTHVFISPSKLKVPEGLYAPGVPSWARVVHWRYRLG